MATLSEGPKNLDWDCGYATFDGTATSVEVPCNLSVIEPGCVNITPVVGTSAPTSIEQLFLQEAPSTSTGQVTVSSSAVTVGRKTETGGTATSDFGFSYQFGGKS